ncbi:MAG: hypothetical protein GYB67_18910 [Chloroflexi bacterium]|nr:hypothetical protein [Chloroflexota bacterium]
MLTLPTRSQFPRWIAIGCGVGVFFWLRLEDNGVLVPVLAGLALTLVLAGWWLTRWLGGRAYTPRWVIVGALVVGAIIGLGTAIMTALLMLLKNGLHGHIFPDFPFGVILEILQRGPAWALAGALIGGGIALAWAALRTTAVNTSTSN